MCMNIICKYICNITRLFFYFIVFQQTVYVLTYQTRTLVTCIGISKIFNFIILNMKMNVYTNIYNVKRYLKFNLKILPQIIIK